VQRLHELVLADTPARAQLLQPAPVLVYGLQASDQDADGAILSPASAREVHGPLAVTVSLALIPVPDPPAWGSGIYAGETMDPQAKHGRTDTLAQSEPEFILGRRIAW